MRGIAYDKSDGCIRFHRAEFLDVFVSHLPPGIAHFGKRISSYTNVSPDKIELKFQDDTVDYCNVLVGCDGIKSTIRRQVYMKLAEEDPSFSKFMDPVFSGTIAYRGLISSERMPLSSEGSQHDALQRPMMVGTKTCSYQEYTNIFSSTVERTK